MQENNQSGQNPSLVVEKTAKKITRNVLKEGKHAVKQSAKKSAKLGRIMGGQGVGSAVPGVGNVVAAGVSTVTEVSGRIIKTGLRQRM